MKTKTKLLCMGELFVRDERAKEQGASSRSPRSRGVRLPPEDVQQCLQIFVVVITTDISVAPGKHRTVPMTKDDPAPKVSSVKAGTYLLEEGFFLLFSFPHTPFIIAL